MEYSNIKTRWVTITPEVATEMLGKNKKNARNINMRKVALYARDLVSGAWGLCDQPIAFYVGGELANGQHRLLAIIKSGVSAVMMVMHDVPIGTRFDLHLPRSMSVQTGLPTGKVACIRSIVGRGCSATMTPNEIMVFYSRHSEAVDFVYGGSHNRHLGQAPMKAVIARAFACNLDRVRLARFLEILGTGISAGQNESAAIRLRNWLLSNDRTGGDVVRLGIYRRTEYALVLFLRGEHATASRELKEEAFPLPEETEQ